MADPAVTRTNTDDDLALLAAWRAGDAQAAAALVRRHDAMLRRFLECRVGDRWVDAIQEVWLAVGRNVPTLELRSLFRVYVLAVAHNKAREFRRQFARERKHSPIDDCVLGDSRSSADEVLERGVLATRLNRLVATMPPKVAQVIELYYVDGLSARRMGARLGVPENTARSKVRRATKQLRLALANG